MSDQLYQDALLALAKRAKESRRIENPDISVRIDNPLCGDRITLDVNLSDGHISEIGHKVQGCVLCQAATIAIEDEAIGKSREEIAAAGASVRAYIIDGNENLAWENLKAFKPVQNYGARIDCVMLPFGAFERAFESA